MSKGSVYGKSPMSKPIKLKHVKSYRSGGKTYYYHRKTDERLPDDPVKRAVRVREINGDPDPKRAIERLKREKNTLLRTIQDLEKTAHDLQERIKSAEAQKRHLSLVANVVDASMRPDAYWPWEPPMPAPKRLRGVYRLMKDGKTVYIGQSVNIISRITEHAAEKDFDQFSYALVDGGREALNDVESALIIMERPPENHGADGRLRHPTGQQWSREEAQAILDEYSRRATVPEEGILHG